MFFFDSFLHENYLDFYDEIEDAVQASESFAQSNLFEKTNFLKERVIFKVSPKSEFFNFKRMMIFGWKMIILILFTLV